MKYSKPIVIGIDDSYEGVYAASGANSSTDGSADNAVANAAGCNSQYIKGVYHAADYNNLSTYIERFGCNGCPAFRYNGCGLQLEQYWGSYDVDNGKRYPNWEKIGHHPDDPIDWNDVGLC
jgi:hypothetical protein